MADENTVSASGADDLLKIAQAAERTTTAIEKMAQTDSALKHMSDMMSKMQATMVNGFMEMATLAAKSDAKMAANSAAAAARRVADEEKAWDKLRFTSQQRRSQMEADQDKADARKLQKAAETAEKQIQVDLAAENRRAAALRAEIQKQDTIQMQRVGSYVKMWEGVLAAQERAEAQQKALQQKRDIELNAMQQRAGVEYVSLWEKMLAERQAIQERRDMEMHGLRAKDHTDYVNWWNQTLATQESKQAKELAMAREQQYALHKIREGGLESQRRLNTSFVTAPLKTQLGIAEQAKVYSSMGGDATSRFGSMAANADIAALRTQLQQLPGAANGSRDAIRQHNEAMRDGHALARGFAGSLGGLWLTYGSLMPIAAGAAIAASLKNIVEVGKDVEYQLKFVEALSGDKVNLNDFLAISGSTVVSVKEAAEGMRALAQNGLDAQESLKVLPTVLNLAVIGEMSVGSAALAATGAMQAFGLSMENIGHLGDVFAQVAAASNTSVALLNESMKQASTVAQVYNVSLEETSAALGTLAKQNITGSAAGVAYTNMLTGLFSPTVQANKALQMLGVVTQNNDGSLKNSTQLLKELRVALSQYNEAAQADIINDIFTNRGAKAYAAMSENIGVYTSMIDDAQNATGMMSNAVMKLEDSTEGAFRRLKNEMSGSLVKAFQDTSPALQALTDHLAHLAGSDGAVNVLTNLATAALKATTFIVEHGQAIGTMAATYALLGPVESIIKNIARANIALAASMNTATTATITMRGALAATWSMLGPIAIALGVATAAWYALTSATDKQESADQRMRNSMQSNIDLLTKETEAIEKKWAAQNRKPGEADGRLAGPALVASLEKQLTDARNAKVSTGDPRTDAAARAAQVRTLIDLEAELKVAKRQAFDEERALAANDMARMDDKSRIEKNNLIGLIEKLQEKGKLEKTINGRTVALEPLGNEQSRAVANSQQLVDVLAKVKDGTLSTAQGQIEYNAVLQDYNKTLQGQPAKPGNPKVIADQISALQEANRLARELQQIRNETAAMQDKAANSAGKLDDLTVMEREYARQRQIVQMTIDEAAANEKLAKGKGLGRGEEAKFLNEQLKGQERLKQLALQEATAKQDYLTNFSRQNLEVEAENLRKKGELQDAFLIEFDAKNKASRTNAELAQEKVLKDLASAAQVGADPDKIKQLEQLNTQLGIFRKNMADAREQGANQAGMDEAAGKFQKALSQLQGDLGELNIRGDGNTLEGMFNRAYDSQQTYADALPGLIQKQRELAAAARLTKDPMDQRTANKAMASIGQEATRVRNLWVDAAQAIGDHLERAFGRAGGALGDLMTTMVEYGMRQDEINKTADRDVENDPSKQMEVRAKQQKELTALQLNSYGAMAGAAKGFFSENSKGYKALEAVQRVFYATETALAMANLATKLFATNTGTAAKVTAVQTEVAATNASVAPTLAAESTKQTGYGISALAASLAAPFPANIAAFATVAAMLAAIGVAVSGGSGSGKSLSAQRQETQGTGSVFGDPSAKSDSIAKSLEQVKENTFNDLNYSAGMLRALQNIETSLGGLGQLVVRAAGVDGKNLGNIGGIQEGYAFSKTDFMKQGAMAGPGAFAINSIISGLSNAPVIGPMIQKLFGNKTKVLDQGITAPAASLEAIASGGLNGQSYADIETTKKFLGLKTSTKTNTQTAALDEAINQQFGQVVINMAEAITQAAGILGVGGDAFTQKLNTFVVDIGKISFKDLTGDEIQEQLQAVFSKVGDDMAAFGVGGLLPLQQVGEGYLETLTRIASEYAAVDAVLASFGDTFGAVGISSAAARDRLVQLSGGLEEFTTQGQYFFDNFLTDSEKLSALRSQLEPYLASAGASGVNTEKGFRDLVMSLDLTTEAGASAYATLMKIAPTFFEAYSESSSLISSTESLTEKLELQAEIYALTGNLAGMAAVKEQQRAQALKELTPEMAALTQQLWALQDADVALTDKLDLQAQIYELTGNAAGAAAVLQQQHALALRGLTPEMAALTQQLWDLQAAANVTTAEDKLRSAYESQKSALESMIDNLKDFRDSILDVAKGLQQGELSTLSPEDKLKAAKSNYEELLARAMSGDESARSQVGQAAQDYLTADRNYNASNSIYAKDASKVQSDLAKLAAAAGKEMDNAQKQLNKLTDTVSQLIDLNTGVDALTEAFYELAKALRATGQTGKADQAQNAGNVSAISNLYQQILGRAPDEKGLAYWVDKLQGGSSLDNIAKEMQNSVEKGNQTKGSTGSGKVTTLESLYKDILGRAGDAGGMAYWQKKLDSGEVSLDFIANQMKTSNEAITKRAVGGFTPAGPVMVGERGPEVVDFRTPGRVYTAEQTAGMYAPSTGTDPVVVALLQQLLASSEADKLQRAEVAKLMLEAMEEQRRVGEKNVRANRAKETNK